MTPYVDDRDFTLYVGDVREVLAGLPAESVDCVVTSPPYWGLRDYQVDRQIGLEATPELFVQAMVEVFREVRRVLAPHGTCWVNLGDSYASGGGTGNQGANGQMSDRGIVNARDSRPRGGLQGGTHTVDVSLGAGSAPGLKPKDLVGIPWRVAFALQADGWWLRSDIVWAKPNPMPESVTDRPTKAHEYVFLLTKQPRYWFDAEAVREPAQDRPQPRPEDKVVTPNATAWLDNRYARGASGYGHNPAGRNVRSVWEIATQPYPEAHFATFPEALPDRCIRAGCPERVCRTCGKPSERITASVGTYGERKALGYDQPQNMVVGGHPGHHNGLHPPGMSHDLTPKERRDLGWSDCGHNTWRPGVVLDPFMGSGTTALVARRLGRRSIGVELNEEYAALCARRLQQLSLFAEEAV